MNTPADKVEARPGGVPRIGEEDSLLTSKLIKVDSPPCELSFVLPMYSILLRRV